MSATRTWDTAAIRSGALVCLVFAIPCSVLAQWAAGRDDGGLAFLFSLGAVAGFVIGAGVAAWVQTAGLPLAHAMITASSTYVAAQAVFVTVKLLRGDDVNFFAVLFNLMAALFAGAVGGALGMFLQRNGVRPRSQWEKGDDGR
ncbi:MAG: hypothetical protein U0Q03_22780 [Acidimicrobiales bacterium]